MSDLNRSTLEVAKFNLASQDIDESTQVCLFTSDLDAVPLKDRALPLVVYECLHHTPDMHTTIERMLRYGYDSICFVEPCSNWLMRIFARLGLAQHEEYSGLEPDRLDLKRLRRLCDRYGYRLEVRTMWELPVDYVERLSRNSTAARARDDLGDRRAVGRLAATSLRQFRGVPAETSA